MDYWTTGVMGDERLHKAAKCQGYMKLEVWQRAVELQKIVGRMVYSEVHIDFKLRSQIVDSVQSVSANIAEGYSRRSLKEYIQFLYIALSSMSEVLTRSIGLREIGRITDEQFEEIDKVHYEIENKLLRLIESLQKKKQNGSWIDQIEKAE